jgi:hypothetical protein
MSCSTLTTCESCAATKLCDWCFVSQRCVLSSFFQCTSDYADDAPDCVDDPLIVSRSRLAELSTATTTMDRDQVGRNSIATVASSQTTSASFRFFTAPPDAPATDPHATLSSVDIALLTAGVVFAIVLLLACIAVALRRRRRRSAGLAGLPPPTTPTASATLQPSSLSHVDMPDSSTVPVRQQTTYAHAPALSGTITVVNPSFAATQQYAAAPHLTDD